MVDHKEPNRDQVAGQVKEVTGNTKEDAGTITGDEQLAREGSAEKLAGIKQEQRGDDQAAAAKHPTASEKIAEGVGEAVKEATEN